MPVYRYMAINLLTRQVIEDLPLYGVNLTRRISGAGNMTGSFKLGTGLFNDDDLLSASIPGLRALVALRDGIPIWAGPLWSRTYQSQANVIQLTGQTYESIFKKIRMEVAFSQVQVDQIQIFRSLIARMQSQQNCNFGLEYTANMPMSGVLRDSNVEQYEYKMFNEPLDDMVKQGNSFDYMIDYTMDANENFNLTVKTGYPYLGYNQAGIDFDYPGSVSNYFWPESAGSALVRQTVLGQGEGTAMPVAIAVNQDLVNAGYPMWESVRAEKSISDIGQLSRIASEGAATSKMPITVPTIDLKIDDAIDFNEWSNLGVPINFHVRDQRFPQGRDYRKRMIGWDYTPASSENVEQVKVVLEGADVA